MKTEIFKLINIAIVDDGINDQCFYINSIKEHIVVDNDIIVRNASLNNDKFSCTGCHDVPKPSAEKRSWEVNNDSLADRSCERETGFLKSGRRSGQFQTSAMSATGVTRPRR